MLFHLNRYAFLITILSLTILIWLIFFPLPGYFSNDEFGSLPLIIEKKFIFSSLPRPIANWSIYLDFLIWDVNPFGFYLTNLLVHIANSILVYLFYLKLVNGETDPVIAKIKAVAAAILFLFYSNNSEVIFWISARASSLAFLFILISLLFFLERNRSGYFIIFSMLAFIASLFIYETSWIVPVAMFALWMFEKKEKKEKPGRFLLVLIAYLFVFITYLAWRYNVSGEVTNAYVSGNYEKGNFGGLIKNIAQLFARTLLPPMHSTKTFVLACSVLFILPLIVIMAKKRFARNYLLRYQTLCLFALFWISLIPASSIGISIHTMEGERFIYLANAFLCMLIIEIMFTAIRKRKLIAVIFSLLAGIQLILLMGKADDYRESNQMTKQILWEVKNHAPRQFDTLYTINQPDNLNGAVMLRKGFEHAIKWQVPDFTFNQLVIVHPEQLTAPYPVRFKNVPFAEMEDNLNSYPIPFRKGKDCIIWFDADTCLFID